mmetsp:Transcript_47267/g.147792  ORF Transcript_47267/g.147792 Transcript_47267/m.147792 type:complete len:415 (-) Transcript_47267:1570-2814(-)
MNQELATEGRRVIMAGESEARRPCTRLTTLKALPPLLLMTCMVVVLFQFVGRRDAIELAGKQNIEVPRNLLEQMNQELATDTKTILNLNQHVSQLQSVVSRLKSKRGELRQVHSQRQHSMLDTASNASPGEDEMMQRARQNAMDNREVAFLSARHRLLEKQSDFVRDFPYWAVNSALADASKGHGQEGEWRADRGPPYVMATTLYSGVGVNRKGSADMVRKILGIKTSFRFHKWEGDSFLTDFDGPQFRYLYRNVHSTLVIPPLERSGGPILGWNAVHRLYLYVNEGSNTLIVLGGPSSVIFINNNVINTDGGYDLQSKWAPGPYERQKEARDTPLAACATTLPGPGTSVHGVAISSLPAEAVSYYESGDVSVMFSIPSGSGRVLYLGYNFAEPLTPWVHALIAATQFPDYKKK